MALNTTLLRSWHAVLAGLLVAGFAALALAGDLRPGWGPAKDSAFLAATGWACLLLFGVALAYVLRKYMHKLGYSPELARRVDVAALERFDERLNEMRVDVLRGALTSEVEIEKEAARHLRETGVQRIVRVEVQRGAEGGPPFVLTARPTEPLGRTARWLHAHAYYGLAMGALVLLHGGGRVEAPLGLALNLLAAVVVLSGVAGLFLWAAGPTWLSRLEREHGLSIEQAHVLHESHKRKLAALLESFTGAEREILAGLADRGSAPVFAERARAALGALARGPEARVRQAQELVTLTGQFHRIDAALRALWRMRLRFMLWRIVHVPCAVLLLGLVLLHVVTVWVY